MSKRKKESNNKALPVKIQKTPLDEYLSGIADNEEEAKRMRVLAYIAIGVPPYKAGVLAGYSEKYSRAGLYSALRSENGDFQTTLAKLEKASKSAVPAYKKMFAPSLLPDIAEVNTLAIQKMKEDPLLAIKHPQLLRQALVAAGVIGDEVQMAPTVNIREVRNLMLNITQDKVGQLPEPPQDAEIVEGE